MSGELSVQVSQLLKHLLASLNPCRAGLASVDTVPHIITAG
jgi:hypothetical protein